MTSLGNKIIITLVDWLNSCLHVYSSHRWCIIFLYEIKKNVKTYACIVFRNLANDGITITQGRLPDKKNFITRLRKLKKMNIVKKKKGVEDVILQVARLVSVTKLTRYGSNTLTPRREGSLILYSKSTAKRWWGNSIHKWANTRV